MRKDSIARLCCCCSHSLRYVFAILLFQLHYFPFFAIYLSHCSSAAEYSRAALFLPVKHLTTLFQLLVHWVLWKRLQWLPFQERKMGGFLVYLTELFKWRGNMETMHTPLRCIVHMCTHGMRKAVWMLPHPLSTQLLHSEAFHRWLRLFSGFSSYWGCQTASDLGFLFFFFLWTGTRTWKERKTSFEMLQVWQLCIGAGREEGGTGDNRRNIFKLQKICNI